MPKQKENPFAALSPNDNKPARKPAIPAEEPAAEIKAPASEEPPAKARRNYRKGRRFIGGHYPPEVLTELKMIGLEDGDKTVQELVGEALNLLFQKKGKSIRV